MKFDAATLARGWLSTALASGKADWSPALNRTVCVEEFDGGVRLVATDSTVLLSAWVPSLAGELELDQSEPGLDEAPVSTSVVMDLDGRGRGLLGYLLAKSKKAGDDEEVEVSMSFGVADASRDVPSFEGMAASWTTFDFDGIERLRLRCYEGDFPNWRALLAHHAAKRTSAISLNPEILGRVAKLGKYHGGGILWTFGGVDKVARIEVEDSEPHVVGLAMPLRSETARKLDDELEAVLLDLFGAVKVKGRRGDDEESEPPEPGDDS